MIKDNVHKVRAKIAQACQASGRLPDEVTLVGVTKSVPLEAVREAVEAGIRDIAENRMPEAQQKFPLLCAQYPQLKTHLIGHVQTNKAREAVVVGGLIHSMDSFKLAKELERQAEKLGKRVDILVQFNTARELQKFGAPPEEAYELIEGISRLTFVHIKGLMTMAPLTEQEGTIRKTFSDLRSLRDGLSLRFGGHPKVELDILSMGMSGDFQIAIEEGSTMVRVGSAIFK